MTNPHALILRCDDECSTTPVRLALTAVDPTDDTRRLLRAALVDLAQAGGWCFDGKRWTCPGCAAARRYRRGA